MLKDGGGSRMHIFERTTKLDEVFQKLKDIYFPNGKNTNKGDLVNLDCNMCDLNLENVNLNQTLKDYIRNNGFEYYKLILKAKKKKKFLADLSHRTSNEDYFKFEEIFKIKIKVKNKNSKSISQCQHQQIQTHDFIMQPRLLMAIAINLPELVLKKTCHGKLEEEKRMMLAL